MKKSLLLAFALFFCVLGFSQNYLMFYNFESVNQNLMVNPSNPHPYRWVVGIPGLSRLSVHYNNTLFQAGDYFNDNNTGDNIETIISNLSDKERFNAYQNAALIYAGFGLKNGYLSFGIQQESTLNFMIPGQLLKFVYYGNENEDGNLNYETNDFNAEAIIQINYHVGYQHWLLDSNLIVGGRFKYISGTANAHFSSFNADLQSDIFEWKIQTDITLETSGYNYIEDFGSFNPVQFMNSGNPGYGIDLGATYLLPKMKFSASVLNIGSIKWTKDIKNYQSQGEFTWQGVDIDEGTSDVDFDEILDSLDASLGFKELTPYSYRTKLPMQIMASYEYQVHPKHAFALTYQGSVWNNNLFNNFGVNYIGRWAKRFNFIMGYGRRAGGLNNFGVGFSGALGPVQLYAMSDNVWGAYKPSQLSAINFRIGLNLVFFELAKKEVTEENKINQ